MSYDAISKEQEAVIVAAQVWAAVYRTHPADHASQFLARRQLLRAVEALPCPIPEGGWEARSPSRALADNRNHPNDVSATKEVEVQTATPVSGEE